MTGLLNCRSLIEVYELDAAQLNVFCNITKTRRNRVSFQMKGVLQSVVSKRKQVLNNSRKMSVDGRRTANDEISLTQGKEFFFHFVRTRTYSTLLQ